MGDHEIANSCFSGKSGLCRNLVFKEFFQNTFATKFSMENEGLRFIRAILKNDPVLLEEIYRRFLPPLHAMLRRNGSGSFADAKDVFQEALVVVFNHAARPDFQLTSSFQAYLLSIGRFIWLRQLKKNARTEVTSERVEGFDEDDDLEQHIFEVEKRSFFQEKFAQLGDDCRQVLQRSFDREPLADIARDMGYTPDYIKKKNKTCKEKLLLSIQKDPRFGDFASPETTKTNPPTQ